MPPHPKELIKNHSLFPIFKLILSIPQPNPSEFYFPHSRNPPDEGLEDDTVDVWSSYTVMPQGLVHTQGPLDSVTLGMAAATSSLDPMARKKQRTRLVQYG